MKYIGFLYDANLRIYDSYLECLFTSVWILNSHYEGILYIF